MTAITAPLAKRKIRSYKALRRAGQFLSQFLTPAKPVLANLISIPLTVAGIACVDIGVFVANGVAGWIVTGISLLLLERMIETDR